MSNYVHALSPRRGICSLLALRLVLGAASAAAQVSSTNPSALLLVPERVFDAPAGTTHTGWAVLVRGDRIAAVGPGVDGWPLGTAVVGGELVACGTCGMCTAGRPSLCQRSLLYTTPSPRRPRLIS